MHLTHCNEFPGRTRGISSAACCSLDGDSFGDSDRENICNSLPPSTFCHEMIV